MSILCQIQVSFLAVEACGTSFIMSSDPSDISALDENPIPVADVQVDSKAEAARPELKRQAQVWAKLKQDPDADLLVFVGRWSKQKGVDLIADVMPSMYVTARINRLYLTNLNLFLVSKNSVPFN
jgi:glycogen synthase